MSEKTTCGDCLYFFENKKYRDGTKRKNIHDCLKLCGKIAKDDTSYCFDFLPREKFVDEVVSVESKLTDLLSKGEL